MTEKENKLLILIGQKLTSIVNESSNNIYIYAEVREMFMSAGIYKDDGNRVVYYTPEFSFSEAVEDLWYARDLEKRWGALRYEIINGQFSVEFDYPDQFHPDEDEDVREERALKARYGDKPIYYPPPEGWSELTEDDLSPE
jgi:hypothetical protein